MQERADTDTVLAVLAVSTAPVEPFIVFVVQLCSYFANSSATSGSNNCTTVELQSGTSNLKLSYFEEFIFIFSSFCGNASREQRAKS